MSDAQVIPTVIEGTVIRTPKPKKEKKPRVRVYTESEKRKTRYQVKDAECLVQVSNDDWYYVISFPEEELPRVESALKEIPECRFFHRPEIDQKQPTDSAVILPPKFKQVWRVRKTDESLKLIAAFSKKYKFDAVGDILMQAQLASSESKDLLKMSFALSCSTLKLPTLPKGCKPMPFQIAGANYAMRVKKTFIADEMGLGKTIQALLTMKLARKWPWLVVVPASVKINWYREAKKWLGKQYKVGIAGNNQLTPLIRSPKEKPYTPEQKKKLIRAGKKWLTAHEVVIVNYDRIQKYSDYLTQVDWKGFVFDESHYCKNWCQRTRSCIDLVNKTDPEYVLNLSGTPVMNNPKELIRQLQLIGRIQEFGGPIHFLNRYCNVVNIDMSKLPKLPKVGEDGKLAAIPDADQALRDEMIRKMYENQIELNTQLRSTCYVRREKEDALPQLPDKTRTSVILDIDNRKEYDRAEKDVIGFLMNRVTRDEKFLKKIAHMSKEDKVRAIKERQNEVGYRSARAEALARIEACKQVAAIGKLNSAQEWMENVIDENGEKLVMFAHHSNIIDELEARFPKNSVSIRGGQSDESRQESVDRFQEARKEFAKEDRKVRLFIGSLKAAGVGITLTKSSTVAFMELGWNPGTHDQAEDRCHRIGQKSAVNAYYLIAKGTIEERIARLIESKRRIVDASSFGDPLSKSEAVGSILGELIEELTGKKSIMK